MGDGGVEDGEDVNDGDEEDEAARILRRPLRAHGRLDMVGGEHPFATGGISNSAGALE